MRKNVGYLLQSFRFVFVRALYHVTRDKGCEGSRWWYLPDMGISENQNAIGSPIAARVNLLHLPTFR